MNSSLEAAVLELRNSSFNFILISGDSTRLPVESLADCPLSTQALYGRASKNEEKSVCYGMTFSPFCRFTVSQYNLTKFPIASASDKYTLDVEAFDRKYGMQVLSELVSGMKLTYQQPSPHAHTLRKLLGADSFSEFSTYWQVARMNRLDPHNFVPIALSIRTLVTLGEEPWDAAMEKISRYKALDDPQVKRAIQICKSTIVHGKTDETLN